MNGRRCTVCSHPRVDEINRAIVAGTSRTAIERKFGITPDSQRRHEENHITEEMRREIVVDLKRERAQETANELNDERLDIAATYDGLARRVGKLIDRAEENGDDSLALASMEGLRRVLSDIAKMQGKLAQQLTVQVSLMDSKEWIVVRDLLERVFNAHPEAKAMFLQLAKRERLSITDAR
ncbi:hypothetical protein [Alteraurantiacibacter aquimixticola]|uniref:Uncharacterized protein n=1 Tax=Alteraurantiacibacter aquimixticola TaxID=2489173 RepID=A0A4T3EZ85_9SPHN|nr:hypothetical protein [Alteraurantiacibacter aquimixticola]TIX48854.1 hypothetical protein E5222_14005 [Alteraurantiacibacter aquimixticola]